MRKIVLLFLFLVFTAGVSFADRSLSTVTAYKATTLTTTLVKRGDARVYSASFVASSNGGYFVILDAITNTITLGDVTDLKAEGSEATSLNGKVYDFSDKPLEFSTGLYIIVVNGYLILEYE